MTDRLTANSCRHYLGLYPDNRPSCAKGRDVRAWAVRCNGGSEFGIGLRLPCTRQREDSEKPLFDCPDIDRRTDTEVEEERAALQAQMGRLISAMPKLQAMKLKMVVHNLSSASATCPFCGEKDALSVSVAIGINNHMRAVCSSCKEGFIE